MDSRIGLPANTLLDGGYRIERMVGYGGFGITYEAADINLGTQVAIKEYYPVDFGDRDHTMSVRPRSERDKKTFEWGRSNFLQEARTLARFEHPSIVRVIRVFEANSTAYMVMRFEQGQSFGNWLTHLGRAPTQEELDSIAGPLLDALQVMHSASYLHRDIAPDNIMVRSDGTPVLLDFGAARRAVAEMSRTLTGIVKAGYSPHEQYTSDSRLQGPWTDLYALGGTLYRAVTGQPPEEATLRFDEDRMQPAAQAGKGRYRSDFLAAIDSCLKVRHSERPQSVTQLRSKLLGPNVPSKPGVANSAKTLKIASKPQEDVGVLAPMLPATARRWPIIATMFVAAVLGGSYGGYQYTRWQPTVSSDAGAEARRKAAEVQRLADLDAERRRQTEAAEAQRLADIHAEMRRLEEKNLAAEEARRRAEAEAARRRAAAEAETERRKAEAEVARRKVEADAEEARRKAAEAEAIRQKADAELRIAKDREALTRSLQTALNKIGCYPSEINGQWNTKGRAALVLFVKHTKLDLPTDEPSKAALEAVVARTGRVCPCDNDKIESNGTCVPKPVKADRAAAPPARPAPAPAPATKAAAQNSPPEGCFNRCIGNRGSATFCNRKCQ